MPEIPFATIFDLEARWRPLDPDEEARAQALLEDASQLILDEVPSAAIASVATLRRITCGIVKRALASPLDIGIASVQQGAGGYQATVQPANPTQDLYLTKADKRALGVGKQRAFSIDLLGGGDAG